MRGALTIGMGAIAAMIGLANVVLFVVMTSSRPVTEFVWRGERGSCPARVLVGPHVSSALIQQFVVDAVINLHSFDYLSWRGPIEAAARQYLTPSAARLFMTRFERSQLLGAAQASYYTVSAIATNTAVITEEGREFGRKYWKIEVPLRIFFEAGESVLRHDVVIQATVRLIDPSATNPNGIGIDNIISVRRRFSEADEL